MKKTEETISKLSPTLLSAKTQENSSPNWKKKDLEPAQKLEAEFRITHSLSEPYDRTHDAKSGSLKIELKFDHQIVKWGNIFVETFSDIDKLVDGGPWRCVRQDVDIIIYVSPELNQCWVFTPRALIDLTNEFAKSHEPKLVKNERWWTQGYALPLPLVETRCIGKGRANSPALTDFFSEIATSGLEVANV